MVEGYLGRLGAGKTYNMVKDTIPYIGKMPIWTNMEDGRIMEWANHFDTWDDVLGLTNAIILIDELGLWAMAREYKAFPKEVLAHIINSRKNGLHIKWTAQSEAGVDVSFRRQTAMYFRHQRYANFIKVSVEDATSGEKMYARWVLLEKRVYDRYDTYEIVGDGEGNGKGQGAAGQKTADGRLAKILQQALVRVVDEGVIRYRPVTASDVYGGADVVKVTPRGVEAIDTRDYRQARVAAAPPPRVAGGGGVPLLTGRSAR